MMHRCHSTILPRMAGLGLVASLSLAASTAYAQWTQQSLFLQPGWNAVYLEIDPEPKRCDDLFAGLPIESVWCWNPASTPVQFIEDPQELIAEDPRWLPWFPTSSVARAETRLHALRGGGAYLVHMDSQAPPMLWTVVGQPTTRRQKWVPDSFNLVGFTVNPLSPPTFAELFAGSPAHQGQPIYRLNGAGHWQQMASPAGATVQPGQAFWIRTDGASEFAGPIEVDVAQTDGLAYGRVLVEQNLRLVNRSPAPATLSVRRLPSQLPPTGVEPALAGDVPLSHFTMDLANGVYGWSPLPTPLTRVNLQPGQTWNIRLEVRRKDMDPYAPPPGVTEALYQSLLEITGADGTRRLVGVTAHGLQPIVAPAVGQGSGGGGPAPLPHPRTGLWVGTASIDKVNEPSSLSDPATPRPTTAPFPLRLMVHVDAGGQARLLQQAVLMWKDGTTMPDPADPNLQIVDEPGREVLVTDESLISQFTGAGMRDGDPIGRRVSTAGFGFEDAIPLAGPGEFGANTVAAQVVLPHDDPANPFLHRYHPDHDNRHENSGNPLPAGYESFTVTREVSLEFSAADPLGLALPGWGDRQIGGTYRETILGLHRLPILVEGHFRLTHASTVPVLNDGL